ncbi:hypothetical protein DFH29DRAFT_881477 [Suillus ampliporus]|nr:hypothetical protein DFH29DRAFT_881477 [Suillus ampliporus]
MYNGIHFQDIELTPLQKFAQKFFSICANLASCERLFSILAHLKGLTDLTELHLHLWDKYMQMGDKKGRLHRIRKIIPDPLPATVTITPADAVPDDLSSESEQLETEDRDASDYDHSLGHIASVLAQRSLEDEDTTDVESAFNDIPLQQLFNFKDESWVKMTEAFGMRSMDDEFKFYKLVDMDVEGEDDEQTFDDMMSSTI